MRIPFTLPLTVSLHPSKDNHSNTCLTILQQMQTVIVLSLYIYIHSPRELLKHDCSICHWLTDFLKCNKTRFIFKKRMLSTPKRIQGDGDSKGWNPPFDVQCFWTRTYGRWTPFYPELPGNPLLLKMAWPAPATTLVWSGDDKEKIKYIVCPNSFTTTLP